MSADDRGGQGGLFSRFLTTVEWLGNLLPHPVTLFALLSLFIVLLSGILGYFDIAVADPRPIGAKGREEDGMIEVISLMSAEGLQRIVTGLVTNFTGFAPLDRTCCAWCIGSSHSACYQQQCALVMNASKRAVTFAIVFAGIISNTASELGYVVLIPLAAMIFHSLGRHPLAGLAAAFAGVSAGYSANLLLGTVDPLLSGITEAAAHMIDPDYMVGPEVNWYFMFISTFVVATMGALVTEKVVEPRLGKFDPADASIDLGKQSMDAPTDLEKKGLRWAGISFVIVCAILALTVVPENGILRHPETGEVAGSPFLKGLFYLYHLCYSWFCLR